MKEIKIGIVIVNYNCAELCLKLANQVSSFTCVSEIVIVDNMSSDNSVQKLSALDGLSIKILCSTVNGGYSYGNNLGVKYLLKKGIDIVFIANPDIFIENERVLKNISQALIEHQDFGIISAMRVNRKNKFNELQYLNHGKNIEYLFNSFCSLSIFLLFRIQKNQKTIKLY